MRHNAFRRSSYLHTQEVTGSSPAVSTTKKPWNHNGSEVFSLPFSGRKEPLCLRYFGVFSGNFGASCCKSVANFFGPLSVVPQGFAGFLRISPVANFSRRLLPKCFTHFLDGLFFPALTIIMRVNTQGHIHSTVASKILHLFDVQSSFKQSCDISVSQNMCCQMLIR